MTEAMQDPDEFVTVEEFIEPVNAQMVKGVLESSGIECFLLSENTNSLLGAAFYAQLQVHKRDEADALKILSTLDDELTADEDVDGEQ